MRKIRHHRFGARRGLSLLEVVVALAIFLFSVLAITHAVSLGSDRALDVQDQSNASMLCQRKLAELMIGAESLGSSGYTAFQDQGWDGWQWKVDATQQDITGLWSVQVTVKYERDDGRAIEVQLAQMMLDPTIRGSNQDPPPTPTSSSSSSSANQSGSGGNTQGSSSQMQSPATPAAAAPKATTPAATSPATSPAAPKTTTPSAPATTSPAAPKTTAPTTPATTTPSKTGKGG
jgi:type II secretion system protein I